MGGTNQVYKSHSRQYVNDYLVYGMVFDTTINIISVISWQSVLLVEETGVPRENHQPVESHWQTLSHNVVSSTPHYKQGSNSQENFEDNIGNQKP